MAEKRKNTCLKLETKREILAEVDKKCLSKTEICRRFGIPKSTLSTFLKNREKIENSTTCQPERKRQRIIKFDIIEEALFVWFTQARAMSVPVSGPILAAKAEELATEMNITDFKSNTGWLDRFKKRHGIVQKAVCGEAGSVNPESLIEWKEKTILELLEKFEPQNVYNADETGLFYRCLPSKTLALRGERCTGGKTAKNRLTVMVAANMDGSDKLPLFVIGKFAKPRCFKHCKQLPLKYQSNKKSWMTGIIFESWVRELDSKFHQQGRKVALVVDNCPAHPEIDNLQAITMIKLPPNTTSVLQPCDQGIIASLKRNYRKIVLQKLIAYTDEGKDAANFDQSILDAMYDLRTAWHRVSAETVSNCFRHAGFKGSPSDTVSSDDNTTADFACAERDNLFDVMRQFLPPGITLDHYFTVDNEVYTAEELTTQEIVASVMSHEEEAEAEEGTTTTVLPPPTSTEARNAIHTLRRYLQAQSGGIIDPYFDTLGELASLIDVTSIKKAKQTSISDFFQVQAMN